MQRLRKIHLYLGCIFAPMIIFFAATGVMQMAGLHYNDKTDSKILLLASSVHVERPYAMKDHTVYNWSSPALRWFVVLMAAGMVLTTVLGVTMAFKFGHRRAAFWCLFAGVVIPVLLVLFRPHG